MMRVIKSLISCFPHIYSLLSQRVSAEQKGRYCYSVWFRHLAMAMQNGLKEIPHSVLEFGCGGSIGVGLASLASGADKYYACDILHYENQKYDSKVLSTINTLFHSRASIPDNNQFPDLNPKLSDYNYPDFIHPLTLEDIESLPIVNATPWYNTDLIPAQSIDFIISQAVLEHVQDLDAAFVAFCSWLKRGALMSHEIDFSSHSRTRNWNDHWQYSAIRWKIINGKYPYSINGKKYSDYIRLFEKHGFKIVGTQKQIDQTGITGPSKDYYIRAACIQAVKI